MFHQIWRLSEAGADNLGLACSDEGLVLGRTPLIERRDGRFVVRGERDIQRLLNRALSDSLEAGNNKKARQEILDSIAVFAKTDPAAIGLVRELLPGVLMLPRAAIGRAAEGIAAQEAEA